MTDHDEVTTLLLKIIDRQEALDRKIDSHVAREEGMLTGMANAFPLRADGRPDFEGHQAYHATIIQEARDRSVLWRELRADLAKKSLWGVVMVMGALIAYWWRHETKSP